MNLKTKLCVGLAIVAALASCKKPSQEVRSEQGNTYASVSLIFNGDDLRAGEDDAADFNAKGTWEGIDKINQVDVYIVDADGTAVTSGRYEKADFEIAPDPSTKQVKLTPKKAIKTTAGNKNVYVVLNGSTEVRQALAQTDKTAFETAWKQAYNAYTAQATEADYGTKGAKGIAALASNDGTNDFIMMSNSKDVSLQVADGVTYDQALAGTHNQAIVEVKRLAARVVTTSKAESFEIKVNDVVIGTVGSLTYSVAQGEKQFFIQQNVETASGASVIKTPAYDWMPQNFALDQASLLTEQDAKYDYSDLHKKDRTVTVGKGTAEITAEEIGAIKNPAFMLEANHMRNTTPNATPNSYDGKFRKFNTPYVLVRGVFTPNDKAFAEGNLASEMEGGTFYVGTMNGKLYSKKENVTDPKKGGLVGQKYRTYQGGKVLYYAYVNPDKVERPLVLNAPVFRNNVYHVHINSITALGYNWNPLYPEDPNSPKPNNPDPKPNGGDGEDPNPPINPNTPLGDTDTYMSVSISVLKWNVHSYDINLGL